MSTKIILGLLACVFVGTLAYAYVSRPAPAAAPVGQTPSASQNQNETPAPTPSGYTLAEVAEHNSTSNCWTAVNGSVYNVTAWISKHPGGQAAILSLCGKDGSSAFTNKHGGQEKPETMLASFRIGALVQ